MFSSFALSSFLNWILFTVFVQEKGATFWVGFWEPMLGPQIIPQTLKIPSVTPQISGFLTKKRDHLKIQTLKQNLLMVEFTNCFLEL